MGFMVANLYKSLGESFGEKTGSLTKAFTDTMKDMPDITRMNDKNPRVAESEWSNGRISLLP